VKNWSGELRGGELLLLRAGERSDLRCCPSTYLYARGVQAVPKEAGRRHRCQFSWWHTVVQKKCSWVWCAPTESWLGCWGSTEHQKKSEHMEFELPLLTANILNIIEASLRSTPLLEILKVCTLSFLGWRRPTVLVDFVQPTMSLALRNAKSSFGSLIIPDPTE